MGDFVDAALGFPAVLFTFLLIVVIGYWLLVAVGVVDVDDDAAADIGVAGVLGGLGLGGVPAAAVLSLLVALIWFVSLAGTVLLGGPGFSVVAVAVMLGALAVGWAATRVLVLALRRALPSGPAPSRSHFVGGTCVIRTGRVDRHFGQAEVTAPDGSSAVVQVRQAGTDPLAAGSPALIYDFDPDGEFFWVVPVDAALRPDPRHPHHPDPHPS